MDIERPPNLRAPGTEPGSATPPGGAGLGGSPPPINALAELVADLIAATGLVPADKLALVRGAAGMGSFAHALVEKNVASSEGLAKTLAARYQMPLVDLALTGVAEDAEPARSPCTSSSGSSPSRTRSTTARCGSRSPIRATSRAIDELRLATRYPLDLGVASREDILAEIRRLARASEAFGARAAVEEELAAVVEEEEEADDLEVDDGISDAPLVRLVNSVIFQAAEDGASDVHFEPQEDSLLVRFRVDGVLQEVQRIPKRMMPGVADPSEGAREARHRRAPQAAGRTHLAQRGRRRPHAGRPRRDAADGRGRVDRHATARQVEEGADAGGARDVRRDARRSSSRSCASRPARCSSRDRRAPVSRRRSTRR